ncbi:uncharacterized protein Mu2 [Anoplolepis gracilipes]|uniref:uncharacterized protein Mu2 n=1 Tax=Anoplolepis gracilipes TaxID=354296 RepID=UPI003BA08267
MELEATQVYQDDVLASTQKIVDTVEEEEPILVGTLSIASKEYEIKRGNTKIGRHDNCDISIEDKTVSKLHAEIEAMRNEGSKIWICDLNSSNKTRLDNEILIPTRFYEIKDGSIIHFGRVRATFRTYRPIVIPETPAPSHETVKAAIIPSTPDSSLNNSSCDDSVIFGTQRDEQDSVFRRPEVPQQRHSTSIDKKNTSHTSSSESEDLQTATSSVNISENRKVPNSNIHDMETQKFEGHETVASNTNIETQIFSMDESTDFIETNTKTNEQLQSNQSKENVQDEVASTSATDIHEMETQLYDSYIKELESQKSEESIRNVTAEKSTTDIYNMETQNFIAGTNKDSDNTKQSEIDKNKSQKKDLDQVVCNINDLETQKFNDKDIAGDISNAKTQYKINDIENATRKTFDVENQLEIDGIANDINKQAYTNKDIVVKTTKNGTNDDNQKDKDKVTEIIQTKIADNVAQSPGSRCSSPGSLNLSSPGVDEDFSSLQHNDHHLLESSDLLEYFGEGIDKHEEIRATNTSTPKSHKKTSLERDKNISNNDEDNIFDALTQRVYEFEEKSAEITEKNINFPKKHGQSIDGDQETDTEEHPEKQHKSLEVLDKSCNDSNRNDPGTSVESEDLYDALTQQSSTPTIKDTSNSVNTSVNQLLKINETDAVDDMAPTQVINNDENTHEQSNLANKPSADITDINVIKDGQKEHVDREKTGEHFTDDSVEQKLTEMFDNVNSSINEPPHMSTQALEHILESSSDNDLFANNCTVKESSLIDNVSRKQLEEESRSPCDPSSRDSTDTEANNKNTVEIDSKNSDTYSASITTRRKGNILKETQKLEDPTQDVISSRQDSNTSQISKINNDKVNDNNTEATEFNKRKTKISRNKSDTMTDAVNDDNVTETISNSKRKERRFSTKKKYEVTSKTSERVLRNNSSKVKVVDAEKDLGNVSNVCAPCPSGERTQTSDLYEDDNDILICLPAVRISGTLSNPASPSTSSTSTEHSLRSKEDNRSKVKGKNKQVVRNKKSSCKQSVEDSKKNESSNLTEIYRLYDKPSVLLEKLPSLDTSKTDKATKNLGDTSEDSDVEMDYKRFKQMADRMLSNELDYLKQHDKKGVQNIKSDKRKSARFSSNLSKDPKQDADDEIKSSSQTNLRVTRRSSKPNNESPDVSHKEACTKTATYDNSTKPETRSIMASRKRTLNTIEKDEVEQTNSRKRKTHQVVEERPVFTRTRRNTMLKKTTVDGQSPNILDYFSANNSRETSPVIGNTRSSRHNKTVPESAIGGSKNALNLKKDENVDSGRTNIKRAKRKNNDDQTATSDDDVTAKSSVNNKQVQAQERQTVMNLSQDKVLKIVLNPIKSPVINPTEDESQEVEMIMGKSLSNVQDKNLSNRETNTAKIFQKKSRSKKQFNTDTESDSTNAEEILSSLLASDSESESNSQLDTDESHLERIKNRLRIIRGPHVSKKKGMFKKPTHINKNVASSVSDSFTESTTSESSTDFDVSSSSRSSRSKTAGVRKKRRFAVTRTYRTYRMVNNSASSKINTSVEITSPATSSTTTRGSTFVLNNSIAITRHKVLFTGITKIKDYSQIVKMLGGNKVEDPAKCSILVTDKVRRTYKFLCALAKGIPIVTTGWLKTSGATGRFLDWEKYILKDPAAEAKFGFRLRESLVKAKEERLLDNYTVVLTPNVAPPPIKELKDIIISCGGKVLLRPPNKWPEKALIISREEDFLNAEKFLAKAPKAVTVQSTEFILTGILKQETDFDKYKLM